MLKGRLGLETARIPQKDRHGLIWLSRGNLFVENGTLRFVCAGSSEIAAGDYALPFQMLTAVLIGPGTTVSHDALRLLARHGTGLVAIGEDGVRYYASMPFGPERSDLARSQARSWADREVRLHVARRMYAWRLGEVMVHAEIEVLRGIEGARVKESYRRMAEQFDVEWSRRRYDRARPEVADIQNQAINHTASAVYAAADIAVAITGAIPALGFIHEESGRAFSLDVADLYRDEIVLPAAFGAVRSVARDPNRTIERTARNLVGKMIRKHKVVPSMIDRIKELFDADDRSGDA